MFVPMKVISLFSGIGGFELAAEAVGWQPIVSCEINPFGRRVLDYYWPDAYHHDDVNTLTFDKINDELTKRFGPQWRSDDIVLTGGFPCQPYSLAGKRKGKDDSRHLWPEMLRIIREVQPTWIVGENVYGLVNWNDGLVFEEVSLDLENEGYEVQPYILPAVSVGSVHRRDRVWFVARRNATNSNSIRLEYSENTSEMGGGQTEMGRQRSEFTNAIETDGKTTNATNSNCEMLEHGNGERKTSGRTNEEKRTKSFNIPRDWETFPTQSPVCGGNDGIPNRLVDITIPRWRKESVMSLGNAIVPQVAIQLFKTIQQYNSITSSS
jgi:DNA (cytosine-5)-methyltransferase 1